MTSCSLFFLQVSFGTNQILWNLVAMKVSNYK